MKKISILIILLSVVSSIIFFGCATPAMITAKSGAELYGENCQRCHNTPAPTALNNDAWEVAGNHMKIRANLTEVEQEKIVEFLKSAN